MFQNFYSKLSEKERKIFYIALIVLLLMVLDRVFLGPVLSRMKMLDEDIKKQENVIKRDLRFLSYKDRILKDDEALKPFYETRSNTIEEIIADFLKKIEVMATESHLNLIKISPSDSLAKKGYIEYYANLECEGLLENVVNFMHAIDTSQGLLKIMKVDMGLKRASGDEVLVRMMVAKIVIASQAEEWQSVSKDVQKEKDEDSRTTSTKTRKQKGQGDEKQVSGAQGSSAETVQGQKDDKDEVDQPEEDYQQQPSSGGGSNEPEQQYEDGAQPRGFGDSQSEEVSERMQMKGAAWFPQATEEEMKNSDAIKPSIWENIMKDIDTKKKSKEE